MRCDQYIGLNDWARNMLDQHKADATVTVLADFPEFAQTKVISREKKRMPLYDTDVIGTIRGAWDDEIASLYRYTLQSGEVFKEYIQAEPWSSGPCYFIALMREDGSTVMESKWTQEEIDDA